MTIPAMTTKVPPRAGSLNAVRAEIPAACYDRSTVRAVVAVAQAWLLYLLPVAALALTGQWWATVLLWPLAGLGVAGLFVIGHDASHGSLVRSPRWNRRIAQVCMAPSAHVEAAWDLGHNRIHHGYTTRQGFDFVWHPTTADEYRRMGRWARARHRIEWSWAGSGLYFLRVVWWQKMWRFAAPGARHRAIVRGKVTLGIVLVAGAVVTAGIAGVLGGWWAALWVPIELFVVPFLLFVHIIGWTVYVHHVGPDIRWWTRRDWSQFRGQMESTTILHAPRVMNRLWFHDIFVHVPHHVDARIRFDHLGAAAAALVTAHPDTITEGRLSLRSYVKATRACKLYDFDAGRWLPYSAADVCGSPGRGTARA